jgi:proteasome component ECM29
MADAQAAEAKELSLVGKVEMRIALASSEKKLQDLLKTYLAPLLLKLGSEHVAVRNKVGFLHLLRLHPSSFRSNSSSERR